MLNDIRRRLKVAEAEHTYTKYGSGQDVFIVFQIENSVSGLILQEKKY